MCKAPKPPAAPTPERPRFLRNPILDSSEGSTVGQLRIGRSSLRSDLSTVTAQRKPSDAPQFIPGKFRQPANSFKDFAARIAKAQSDQAALEAARQV